MRHVEGAAQRVAELVVQRDARRAQDAAGEPAAIERVAPRLRIGGIGLDQRQAPGARPDAFLRHQGDDGIAVEGVKALLQNSSSLSLLGGDWTDGTLADFEWRSEEHTSDLQ